MEKEEAVSWFTSSGWENRVSLSDLITESEFEAMIAVCMNSKDMALLSCYTNQERELVKLVAGSHGNLTTIRNDYYRIKNVT